MNPDDVLKFFATQSEVARVCRVPESNVSRWFTNRQIPWHHQARLCVVSGGKLKLGRLAVQHAKDQAALWSQAVALST